MARSVSAEYEALVRCTFDLQQAVANDVVSLGAELLAAELITVNQQHEMLNGYRPERERAADLIGFIQNQVHQNPQRYHTFIGVLMKDDNRHLYHDILVRLQETFNGAVKQPIGQRGMTDSWIDNWGEPERA